MSITPAESDTSPARRLPLVGVTISPVPCVVCTPAVTVELAELWTAPTLRLATSGRLIAAAAALPVTLYDVPAPEASPVAARGLHAADDGQARGDPVSGTRPVLQVGKGGPTSVADGKDSEREDDARQPDPA